MLSGPSASALQNRKRLPAACLKKQEQGPKRTLPQMFYAAFGDQYEVEFVWVEQSEATSGDLEGGQDDGSDGGQGDAESGDGGQEQ